MTGSAFQRYIISVALALPLGLAALGFSQLQGASPAFSMRAENVLVKRPASAVVAPPPTLAPAPTPQPTPTSIPQPTPTAAARSLSYTVQAGDQLKHIAASYGVSIWKVIDLNKLDDPDNLRAGQVLRIPEN